MSDFSRRGALWGALVCGAALSTPARAMLRHTLPTGPMQLSRRIERGLRDGAMIIVERKWAVRFVRQGSGCAITGQQTSVAVDAPASLAPLKQIEESRSTDSMWPILLSEEGIVLATGRYILEEDLAQAVREAERMISERTVSPDAKGTLLQNIALMQRSAGKLLDQMPGDLFFPASPPMRTIQAVTMEGGLKGEFDLSYEASPMPSHPWLERAERRITTRIGETERRSREVWTMTSI